MIIKKIKKYLSQNTNYGRTRYINYLYDCDQKKYLRHRDDGDSNVEYMATEIRLIIHAIEKGLSLPYPKTGFGKEKILKLIELIKKYKQEGGKDTQAIKLSYDVIDNYIEFNEKKGADISFLPSGFIERYDKANNNNEAGTLTIEEHKCLDFFSIAHNRHSCRYFSKQPVSIEQIKEAVSIARTAPSACNRQSVRVYATLDKEKIRRCMELQGGVNGFGMPTCALVVTANLNLYKGDKERNTAYIDGGIFIMNLLYALDSCGIASCPAIWSNIPEDDLNLAKVMGFSDNELAIAFIFAGGFPEKPYRVARARRREIEDVLKICD